MRFTTAPLLAALSLCACTAEPLAPPNLIPVASVTVEPPNPVVGVGAQAPLTPVPKDAAGNTLTNRVFTWATSDPAVATVDGQGVVTGVAAGTAQITATAEGKSGSVTLTVSTTAVASVTVTPPSASVNTGATTTLAGAAFDAGGAPLPGRVFAWSSANAGIAAVTSLGVVHGIAPGTATITGTSEGKSATATVTVVLAPVASVTVAPATGTVGLGASLQLTATVQDAGGNTLTGRAVTWQSSNPLAVTVSGTGLARGVGQGDATITATSEGISGTAAIGGRLRFASVSAGQDFSCGVTPIKTVFCWGRNAAGALGNGTTSNSTTPVPVTMPPGVLFDSVSAGQDHACGLATTGAVFCWGGNAFGQLGNGGTSPQTTPTLVSAAGVTFASVSAAAKFTCALTTGTNATVECWGLNDVGQLGTSINAGTSTPNTTPLEVTGGPFRAVSATQGHACAILSGGADGTVVCWGLNDAAQLARGGGTSPPFDQSPQAIFGSVRYAEVSAGVRFTCAVESTTSTADCWGLNEVDAHQLGTSTLDTVQSSPVAVNGGLRFSQLATGQGFACGVTTGDQGYCWGDNSLGQLGIGGGPTPVQPGPQAVTGSLAFSAIDAGYFHACGVTTGGVAWCWGRAQDGLNPDASALGNGATGVSGSPVEVTGQE
ncbi:MAG: Ig-like domain-containing protein [Deltaproteobacteria bacterium]